MVAVTHAGLTEMGRTHGRNQDRWVADAELGLCVVADGMGGRPQGEAAAEAVVEALPRLVRKELADVVDLSDPSVVECLRAILVSLSNEMRDRGCDKYDVSHAACTVVMFLIRGDKVLVAHMGDSRSYLLRNKQLKPLTKDHTYLQSLIDAGDYGKEGTSAYSPRGEISRYIGMEDEPQPEIAVRDILAGDNLLLCCDGLNKMVSDEDIRMILKGSENPVVLCQDLMDAVDEAGRKDDTTIIVLVTSGGGEG